MKVLITGGAGYVGTSLVKKLNPLPEVEEIIVLDNLSSASNNFFLGSSVLEKVKFVHGDILNYDLLEKLIVDVEVIFHLASYTNHAFTYAQNIKFEQINQWGTLNLVRAIQQKSKSLKKCFYLSSLSVFGLYRDIDIETAEPQPNNAYGKSKYEAEKYMGMLNNQCQISVVRAANVFGFNECFRKDSVLNNFIFNTLISKKILIYGNGEQSRSFVHVENVAEYLRDQLFDNNESNLFYKHLIDFNARMNDIKDWLLSVQDDIEFTYLNTNINYDSQFVTGFPSISDKYEELSKCFEAFADNVRIRA